MQKLSNERITITYENDMSGNKVVLNLTGEEKIIDYQVKMIQSNPSVFFIPFKIKRKNEKTSIVYEIDSKISAMQFLKNKIGRQEVVHILRNLVRAIKESINYLLDEKSFVIHENYIYISPDNLTVSLIYAPINLNADFAEGMKRFASNLIDCASEPEHDYDIFINEIVKYLKTNDFNLEDFNCILEGIQKQKGFKDKGFAVVDKGEDFKISIPKAELLEKSKNSVKSINNSNFAKERRSIISHFKHLLNLDKSEGMK